MKKNFNKVCFLLNYLYIVQVINNNQNQKKMETTTKKIPKGAFSEMMSAYVYFDKVDEGCGYDRLNAKKSIIMFNYNLSNDELAIVEEWAYNKYYKN